MNIVKLKTQRYEIDWTYEYEINIDVDKYAYFIVEYRLASWHLIGGICHKNEKEYTFEEEELSYDYVIFKDMVDFIVNANNIEDKYGHKICKVADFKNLHQSPTFCKELTQLLQAIEKKQNDLENQKQ